MAKLLAPDGLITPFLHLVGFFISAQNQQVLSGSLEFESLSRLNCAKSRCKSGAAAVKEIPTAEFSANDYLCQKLKIWIRFVLWYCVRTDGQ